MKSRKLDYYKYEKSRKQIKTPNTHPYSYDPFEIYNCNKLKTNGSIYTDRLLQFNFVLHDKLCEKHFGDKSQYWDNREPSKIECFLRDWMKNDLIALTKIIQYCNVATGNPVWRLDYHKPNEEEKQ